MKNQKLFFKKRKKIYFHKVLENLNIKNKKNYKNFLVNDIQTIAQAKKNDITFFHSSKYKDLLNASSSNFIIFFKSFS